MARLYRYAESNEKSGYFLRGISESGNTTFQVTHLGEQLFDYLEFQPGVVNTTTGPQIPPDLMWIMYDAGLIFTENDDRSNNSMESRFTATGEELNSDLESSIQSFLSEASANRQEIRRLQSSLNAGVRRTTVKKSSGSGADYRGTGGHNSSSSGWPENVAGKVAEFLLRVAIFCAILGFGIYVMLSVPIAFISGDISGLFWPAMIIGTVIAVGATWVDFNKGI